MNDEVFNTLAAVVLSVCAHHFSTPGVTYFGSPPPGAKYEAGFEQCTGIVAEWRAERGRRERDAVKKASDDEKARVTNALAALRGKPFKPESAPVPQPQVSWSGCTMLTPDQFTLTPNALVGPQSLAK